jgi:hypothetical protein
MKRWLLFVAPLPAIFLLAETNPVPPPGELNRQTAAAITQDSFDQAQAIAGLRAAIEGREEQPASEVFTNLTILGGMPAGRLLSVMEMGFAGSLGVNCTHCHHPEDWASEAKPTKQIARDMMIMTQQINQELLPSIENLGGEDGLAIVNCTTCHRGQIVPALNRE